MKRRPITPPQPPTPEQEESGEYLWENFYEDLEAYQRDCNQNEGVHV